MVYSIDFIAYIFFNKYWMRLGCIMMNMKVLIPSQSNVKFVVAHVEVGVFFLKKIQNHTC